MARKLASDIRATAPGSVGTCQIGFDTWFAQPQVTLHGIPFTLTTGRADLVRLPLGGRLEMGLPVCQASVMHLLLTGGYLPTAGSVRVEVTYTNGFREEHTLDVNDWNPGARCPDVRAQTFDATAFGGQSKSLYVQETGQTRGWPNHK